MYMFSKFPLLTITLFEVFLSIGKWCVLISPKYLILFCKIDHNYLIFMYYATKNTVKISEIHTSY